MSDAVKTIASAEPAWKLDWLTPVRCRLILLMVLGFGFASRLLYLHHSCPIDLGGDEAQYWDWSRNLGLSYYSKGPAVAYIIRASCAMFGDTMQAVRYPALVFSVLTSFVMYALTRRLFGSDRLALGAVLLLQIMPLFVAGGVLMTIDPPMFFCWGLATYLAAMAIFDKRPSMWVLVGIAIGLGFLAKYSAMLWYVGALGFLFLHSSAHQRGFALSSLIVSLMFTLPVIMWNQRHDWVSFHHVARQTGASSGAFNIGNPFEFIVSQLGVVAPTMAILMIAAVVYTMRSKFSGADTDRPKLLFLLWIGMAFFAINLLASLRTKVQANWPAPAYFTLVILCAYFIAARLQSVRTWKPWRVWFWATVIIGLPLSAIIHNTPRFYGMHPKIAQLDPELRLVGWQKLGIHVAQELSALRPGAFVMCDDYQQTAELAFYVPGQPRTYCAGSYFGKRLSQYDMWPDRRLDASSPLVGRDAVYVGKGGQIPAQVSGAFEEVEKLPEFPIMVNGRPVRTFKLWRCRGFVGMKRASGEAEF